MSQQIYLIQLLNDLHNHFPEILYNPERFQNVQDLLAYIRNVASFSPYDIGLQQYNSRHNTNYNNRRQNGIHLPSYRSPIAPAPPIPAPPTPADIHRLYNRIPVNTTVPQAYVATTIIDESDIPQTSRVRIPVNTDTNVLMNTLLGGLFGDILGTGNGINLNNFLNERVAVYPTNNEINNATTQQTATAQQEDICAICQDEIEVNQEMRRINHCGHYFHQDCIDTWFRGNVHCPTCRHDIREMEQNNETTSNPPPVPENHRRTNIRRPDIA